MTERLYLDDPDLLSFSARVLSCVPRDGQWLTVLDRTAFFPEGGGQGADRGTIAEAGVTDVQQDAGIVYHTSDRYISPDMQVDCLVDARRRLDMMQQHSGEHIFSGLVCHTYGCSNVGFHIGTDAVTMDFDRVLTEQEALEIERRANEAIWADLPIRAWIPPRGELEATEYRSKKAIDGDVRLVSIPGIDICACCGTHVQRTGRVGQIKLLGVQKYKKGVRVSILCGRRALEHENLMLEQLRLIARQLSGKQQDAAAAVERLLQERDRLRAELEAQAMRLFLTEAQKEAGHAVRVIACDALQPSQMRRAAEQLSEGASAAIVLLPREEGWSFTCASAVMDIRPMTKCLTETFGGKGGGPRDMTQGALASGTAEEIRAAAETALQGEM